MIRHVSPGVADIVRPACFNDAAPAGAPGFRPEYRPDYYAAFAFDPDGHKVEAVRYVNP